jgi:hypothetical protein
MVVVSLIIRAALIYLGYLVIRKVWMVFNNDQVELKNKQQRNSQARYQQQNDNIVEADYEVLNEKEID